MVANRQQGLSLLVAAALLLPVSVMAQYPMIDKTEGFEVDMEPFWVETEYDDSNSVPLDVQGYFKTEMEVVLPNILGVLLRRYDDDGTTTSTMDLEGGEEETRTNSSTARVFYTGMAVFRGPPFRTNHDVYQAQTAAMTSLQAAKTYLKVHDASLGIPDWFNSTALENPDKAVMMEETDDGSLTINPDLLLESTAKGSSSLEGIVVGGALGLVVGSVLTFIGMVCYKRHLKGNRDSSSSAPCTPRRHKRKSSDDSDLPVNDPRNQLGDPSMDYDIDINSSDNHGGGGSSSSEGHDEGGDFLPESFHDEEVADGEEVISFTNSPVRSNDLTPRKRRPSHHRRWKSTATFTDMQSPSSVMDGLFMNGSPPTSSTSNSTTDSNNSSHRRSSSFADAFGVGGLHRRSKSVADAFSESVADVLNGTVTGTQTSARDRRDSMMELLGGVDMADLMNDLDMDLDRLE